MRKKAIGLEFTDRYILFIEIIKEKNQLRLGHWDKIQLPGNLIESGKPQELTILVDRLRPLFVQKLFNYTPLVVGIPGIQVFVRKIVLPIVPENELKKIVNCEGEAILPYPIDEAIYSYQILGESVDKYQILFTAIRKELLDNYLRLFRRLNLAVQVLSLQSFGLVNIVEYLGELDKYNGVLVRLNSNYCDLVLIYNGDIELIRTITLSRSERPSKDMDMFISELISTLEHYQSLHHIWLNKGIFCGLRAELEIIRQKMPTFHWKYLTIESSLIAECCQLPGDFFEEFSIVFGLALIGVIK